MDRFSPPTDEHAARCECDAVIYAEETSAMSHFQEHGCCTECTADSEEDFRDVVRAARGL